MSEQNKAIFRQVIDGMNAKDISIFDRLLAENYVEHNQPPGFAEGPQGMKDMMQGIFTAFPDLKMTVNQLIAQGDLVVGAMSTEGTQTGDFMGIPASGKKISIEEMHIFRIANGQVVEHWGLGDSTAMMEQLGIMPEE